MEELPAAPLTMLPQATLCLQSDSKLCSYCDAAAKHALSSFLPQEISVHLNIPLSDLTALWAELLTTKSKSWAGLLVKRTEAQQAEVPTLRTRLSL